MREPDPHEDNRLSLGDVKPVSFGFRKDAPPGRRMRWAYAKAWGVPPWLIFGGRGDVLDRIWWRWQEIDSLWTLMLWGPIAWMVLYVTAPVLVLWRVARYIRNRCATQTRTT